MCIAFASTLPSRTGADTASPMLRPNAAHASIDKAIESDDREGEVTHPTTDEGAARGRFWKYIQEERAGLEDGDGEHYHDIEHCLQNRISEDEIQLLEEQTTPIILDKVVDGQNRTVLVEIGNAISPLQARALKDLAACTRIFFPKTRLEHRAFEGTDGGNDVTFVNILLQIFLPSVSRNVARIATAAYDAAGWGSELKLRHPSECGLRTSEYLDYGKFRGLGVHEDAGSIFTVLFALADSKSYRGGEYYIEPRGRRRRAYHFKPRMHSAIVFLSETHHGVTDIEFGKREMFANELWMYDDPPWPSSRRPDNEQMELFVARADGLLGDGGQYRAEHWEELWPLNADDELARYQEEGDPEGYFDYEESGAL